MTILLSSMNELIAQVPISPNSSDVLSLLIGDFFRDAIVLAQQVSDPDLMGRIKKAWDNFLSSGQVWALVIGMVLGYLFRGFRGT